MSRVSELPPEYAVPGSDQTLCMQCGEPTTKGGHWMSANDSYLCSTCAHDPTTLAALMADAIVDGWPNHTENDLRLSHVNSALLRFEKAFWRALFLAVTYRERNT